MRKRGGGEGEGGFKGCVRTRKKKKKMYKIVQIVPFIILRMTSKNENSREIKNAKNLNLNTNFLGGSGGWGEQNI